MLKFTFRIAIIACVALTPLFCRSGVMPCCLAPSADSQPAQSCCHTPAGESHGDVEDSTSLPLSPPSECCFCQQGLLTMALPVGSDDGFSALSLLPTNAVIVVNDPVTSAALQQQPASEHLLAGRNLRIVIASWIC